MDLIIQIHSDNENSHYPLCDEVTNSTALTVGISLSCSVAYVITRFKSDIDKKFMKAQSLHQHRFRFIPAFCFVTSFKHSRVQTAVFPFFYFYRYYMYVHFRTLPVSWGFFSWHWFNWTEIKLMNNSAVSHQSFMENIVNNAFWAFINHLRFVIKYSKWDGTQ